MVTVTSGGSNGQLGLNTGFSMMSSFTVLATTTPSTLEVA